MPSILEVVQLVVDSMLRKQERWLNAIRLFNLKARGARIGDNVRCFGRVTVAGSAKNISIGRDSTLNEGVFLNARTFITIGERVHLSPGVQVHTGMLDLECFPSAHKHRELPITIGNDVWLASNAVISGGCSIGDGTVVGANSVLLGQVYEDGYFYAGVPAQKKRKLRGAWLSQS